MCLCNVGVVERVKCRWLRMYSLLPGMALERAVLPRNLPVAVMDGPLPVTRGERNNIDRKTRQTTRKKREAEKRRTKKEKKKTPTGS